MPIKFRQPQDINAIRFGATLVWGIINGAITTITGASPLALVNALAKPIKNLIQYGKCALNGADIVCNNGTLGFVNDDIPEEYVRLEYLESTGTQYIDSGVKINYAQAKNGQIATVQYTKSNSTRELMGSNGYGFWGKSASNKFEAPLGNTVTVTESALSKSIVSLTTNPSTNSVVFNVNGKSYTASASTFADNYYSVYIFALGGREGAAASFFCNARVYDYIIKIDDVILAYLLPVKRRSDGVLGMYDIVTNTFKTNAGTGTFVAGPAGSVATINDVPSEYIELEYLESSGTQYIDTGIVPSLDITAEADYFGGANYAAYGARWSGTPNNDTFGIYRSGYTDSGGARIIAYYGRYGNGEYGNFIVNSAPRFRTYIGTDSATVNEVTLPISRESISTNLTMYLFAMNKDDEAAFGGMVRIYSLKFFRNGQAIADYIPCKRRSDGTLGMYDAITNTFKTNDGTGTFVAGPAVDHIGVIGTPEVITVSGANLLDLTTVPNDGKYIAKSNGLVAGTASTWAHSGFIPVEEGKKYYFGYKPFTASAAGMAWYNSSKTYISGKSATEIRNSSQKLTAPSGASFVRFTWSTANGYDTDWRNTVYFCEDGAMTKFEPYVTPQTASVENLFAVGDTKDEQDIISGVVTRRCEAVISDGTTPSGRYIGTVGEGNIIVKARETGYEGDIVTFDADRVAPLNGLTVNVEPIQAGSGDPSLDNIRPISGRTSATVTRTGKNLFNRNATPFQEGAYISLNATTVGGSLGFVNHANYNVYEIHVVAGQTYTFGPIKASDPAYAVTDSNGIVLLKASNQGGPSGVEHTVQMPSESAYLYLSVGINGSYKCDDILQVKNRTSIHVSWEDTAGTVYGGTLDVITGKMMVTDANIASYAGESLPSTWISDRDVYAEGTTPTTGAQVVYKLAEPFEITLTPTQIDTLLGENNLWADAGTIKAYIADAELIEHVTPQPMRTVEGSNTVSVTSNVDPVQLEIEYYKDE